MSRSLLFLLIVIGGCYTGRVEYTEEKILFFTNDTKSTPLNGSVINEKNRFCCKQINIKNALSSEKVNLNNEICNFDFITGVSAGDNYTKNCEDYKRHTNSYYIGSYDDKVLSHLVLTEDVQEDTTFYVYRVFMLNYYNGGLASIVKVASDYYTPYEYSQSYSEINSQGVIEYKESYKATDVVTQNVTKRKEVLRSSYEILENGKIRIL